MQSIKQNEKMKQEKENNDSGQKKEPRRYISSQGRRADLDNRFFRSKMEANYARYLNLLKANNEIVDWQYEAQEFEFPIKRGTRFYKPDFKVFLNNGSYEFHEVKGYMDAKSKTMLKRMRIHHPKQVIKVIDKSWLKANERGIKPLIPGWE